MKIKLNQLHILTSALFQSLFDQEIAIEIRQVHKRFIKLPVSLLFWHDVLDSFWTSIFTIEGLDYILSLIKARNKIKSKKA